MHVVFSSLPYEELIQVLVVDNDVEEAEHKPEETQVYGGAVYVKRRGGQGTTPLRLGLNL